MLDLNSLVNRMSEMLLGVLSEEMEFVVKLDPDPCCISADPGQIEQVIMNLVVNARDAMPKGGSSPSKPRTCGIRRRLAQESRIRVATGRLCHAGGFRYRHWHGRRDPEQIFEPFFTTKCKMKAPAWDCRSCTTLCAAAAVTCD